MCPGKAPTAFRLVCHRPNPKKRPQHMQGEQAYPACGMDCVLVGMMAPSCDPGRYVMDRNDAVEDRHDHENEQPEREPVQEWVAYLIYHFGPSPLVPHLSPIETSAPVGISGQTPRTILEWPGRLG